MEEKLKHLEIIQGVINRMAHCSFLLKGWSVILVSGLFALASKGADPQFVYIAYLPVVSFWILDGYYLYQERLYRNLYGDVRKKKPEEIDFDMNAARFKGQNKATWLQSVFSVSINLFHGILMVTVAAVMFACMAGKGEAGAQASLWPFF